MSGRTHRQIRHRPTARRRSASDPGEEERVRGRSRPRRSGRAARLGPPPRSVDQPVIFHAAGPYFVAGARCGGAPGKRPPNQAGDDRLGRPQKALVAFRACLVGIQDATLSGPGRRPRTRGRGRSAPALGRVGCGRGAARMASSDSPESPFFALTPIWCPLTPYGEALTPKTALITRSWRALTLSRWRFRRLSQLARLRPPRTPGWVSCSTGR